jgi:hypothetical protein
LERGKPLNLKNLDPLPPKKICSMFAYNWPCGSGEEVENVKVHKQTDRQTEGQTDGRQVIRIDHLSFQLR